MIENLKEIFKIGKELIVDFFGLVNDNIENDNLFDAFLLLLIGGALFGGFMLLAIVIMLAIINCPCVVFFLLIPFLPCIYIWWMKRRIKRNGEKKSMIEIDNH